MPSKIRHVFDHELEENDIPIVEPTVTDLLAKAEQKLAKTGDWEHMLLDARMEELPNLRKFLKNIHTTED